MVSMAKKTRNVAARLTRWRVWVQLGFLAIWLDPLVLRLHGWCGPVFHCYSCPLATFACPIGIIANFSALHLAPLLALGTLVIFGAFFGGFLCGWACPFGLLQDLAGRLPTRKFHLPLWTGYLRYAVLIGLVGIVPFFWGPNHPLFICRVCPAGGLESALPRALQQQFMGDPVSWPTLEKWVVMGLFAGALLIWHRPWCRVCPLGAIFGLFNRVSGFFLKFNPQACTACQICHQKCPAGLRPEKDTQDQLCLRCLECAACPSGALDVGYPGKAPASAGKAANPEQK